VGRRRSSLKHWSVRALALALMASVLVTVSPFPGEGATAIVSPSAGYVAVDPIPVFSTLAARDPSVQQPTTATPLLANTAVDFYVIQNALTPSTLPATIPKAVTVNVRATAPEGGPLPTGALKLFPTGPTLAPNRPPIAVFPESTGTVITITTIVGNAGRLRVRPDISLDLTVEVTGWYAGTTSGGFHPVMPNRIFDTVPTPVTVPPTPPIAQPTSKTPLAAGAVRDLDVAHYGGVPSWGVSAVVLQVTVTSTGGAIGDVRVWPKGLGSPDDGTTVAPSIFYEPDSTRTFELTSKLGNDGQIRLKNTGTGAADVTVDVTGWHDDNGKGAGFNALAVPPVTAAVTLTTDVQSGPNHFDVAVNALLGVNASAISAVSLHVRSSDATGSGALHVFPDLGATATSVPVARAMTTATGRADTTRVTVPTATLGVVRFHLEATNAQTPATATFTVEVAGYFGVDSSPNYGLTPLPQPFRLALPGASANDQTADVTIAGRGMVPRTIATGVTAAIMNVHVDNANAADATVKFWAKNTTAPVRGLGVVTVAASQKVHQQIAVPLGSGALTMSVPANVVVTADVIGWYDTDGSIGGSDHGLSSSTSATVALNKYADAPISMFGGANPLLPTSPNGDNPTAAWVRLDASSVQTLSYFVFQKGSPSPTIATAHALAGAPVSRTLLVPLAKLTVPVDIYGVAGTPIHDEGQVMVRVVPDNPEVAGNATVKVTVLSYVDFAPAIEIYGGTGNFQTLESPYRQFVTGSGTAQSTRPMADWQFDAGVGAWFPEKTADGKIVMSSMSQLNAAMSATYNTMSVGVFDTVTKTFDSVQIRSRLSGEPGGLLGVGAPRLGAKWVGGADVSDVCGDSGTNRVFGVSQIPYKSWQRETTKAALRLFVEGPDEPRSFSLSYGGATRSISFVINTTTPAVTANATRNAVQTALRSLLGPAITVSVAAELEEFTSRQTSDSPPSGVYRSNQLYLITASDPALLGDVTLDESGLSTMGSTVGAALDAGHYGEYPALAVLDSSGTTMAEAVGPDGALLSATPDELFDRATAAAHPDAGVAFPQWVRQGVYTPNIPTNAFGEGPFRDAGLFNECKVLPHSKDVVITRYSGSTQLGRHGTLVVLSGGVDDVSGPIGTLTAYCGEGGSTCRNQQAVPWKATPTATPVTVVLNPKSVVVDPTDTGDTEHIIVNFDAPGMVGPGPIQEFEYKCVPVQADPCARRELIMASPLIYAPMGSGRRPGFGSMTFASDGTLIVEAESPSDVVGEAARVDRVFAFTKNPTNGRHFHDDTAGFFVDNKTSPVEWAVGKPKATWAVWHADAQHNHRLNGVAYIGYSAARSKVFVVSGLGVMVTVKWNATTQVFNALEYDRTGDGVIDASSTEVNLGFHPFLSNTASAVVTGSVREVLVDDASNKMYITLMGRARLALPDGPSPFATDPTRFQYLIAVDLRRLASSI